jgi:hypothetical protein
MPPNHSAEGAKIRRLPLAPDTAERSAKRDQALLRYQASPEIMRDVVRACGKRTGWSEPRPIQVANGHQRPSATGEPLVDANGKVGAATDPNNTNNFRGRDERRLVRAR